MRRASPWESPGPAAAIAEWWWARPVPARAGALDPRDSCSWSERMKRNFLGTIVRVVMVLAVAVTMTTASVGCRGKCCGTCDDSQKCGPNCTKPCCADTQRTAPAK